MSNASSSTKVNLLIVGTCKREMNIAIANLFNFSIEDGIFGKGSRVLTNQKLYNRTWWFLIG